MGKTTTMKKTILILSIFLLFSCGTKTKTKTESSRETELKQTAKAIDSAQKIDLLISKKVEERLTEIREQTKVTEKTDAEDKTVTTTTEIQVDKPATITLSDGRVLNIDTGRITETKTTTNTKKATENIRNRNIEISEKAEKQIDETNMQIDTKKIVKEILTEINTQEVDKASENIQKGWKPGFWFWFWIVLIILLIIAFFVFRKWLAIQFPFLRVFKIFK
jgi:hypothetical protein